MSIKAKYKVTGFPDHAKFVNGSPVKNGQELMMFPETAACYPFLTSVDGPEVGVTETPPNASALEAIKPKPLLPRPKPGGGLAIGTNGD